MGVEGRVLGGYLGIGVCGVVWLFWNEICFRNVSDLLRSGGLSGWYVFCFEGCGGVGGVLLGEFLGCCGVYGV